MDYNQVKDLIKTIQASNLTELTLQMDNVYVQMSKLDTPSAVGKAPGLEVKAAVVESDAPMTILPEEKQPVVDGSIVTSPIVGTFYEGPAPEKPPFLKKGDMVKKGSVLCIIEAMKVMNEIVSEYDGKVAEIMVKNEALVEYGQPLFRIV